MSKLDYLTIGIVAICLAAVIFIMIKVYDLGRTDNPIDVPPTEPETEIEEPDTASESAGDPAPPPTSSQTPPDANQEADDLDDEELTDPIEENIPSDQYQDEGVLGDEGGNFLVLAGSFRLRSGAEAEVQRLKKLGYKNAEVTLFNAGTFAAVLVDRFDNVARAEALASELQAKHKVEAYVHEKRQGEQ
jgi:cell division septation protein DedD